MCGNLCIGIMERPIRTCRVVKGNEHEYMLKEVDRVEFHHMLLSTVRAECSQSKHTKKGQGQSFYFFFKYHIIINNLDKNSIH